MAEPPEMWTFILSNFLIFGFGLILTGLSYFAYRSGNRNQSFLISTIGFGFITLGGIMEPIYQLMVKGDYNLGGRELLSIQTVEGVLVAIGLALLFYSIYRHNYHGSRTVSTSTSEQLRDL